MNYTRLLLASLTACVTYFAFGGLVFGLGLAREYALYPALYRNSGRRQRLPLQFG